MAQLVITQNITVDGVVEMIGDWFHPIDDDPAADDVLAATRQQMEDEEVFLVGRKTFLDMRGYWPAQTDDQTGITDHLNQIDKVVVSTTLDEAGWENSTIIERDLLDRIAELKRQRSGDIGITGSITLCHALMWADLVDELRLFIYPRVLGSGRRLFPDRLDLSLDLVDTTAFANGQVLTIYRPR